MVAARKIAAAAAGSVMMILGACATTHGSLASSADRLERNADMLARNARDDSSFSGFSRDARDLAEQAHDFRRTVEDRRADDQDVRRAFEDLSHDYHDLRDEVDRSGSREAQEDFAEVTDAYLDIERALGGYRDDDRVARDRDRDDRRRY